MKMTYSYDDIALIPRELSKIKSRDNVNLSTIYPRLEIPIVASPMDTVCNGEMAAEMNKLGGVGIIHRFQSIDQQIEQLQIAENSIINTKTKTNNIGIAVGVTGDYKKRLLKILKHYYDRPNNVDSYDLWICFDTANGYTELIKAAILYLNSLKWNDIFKNKFTEEENSKTSLRSHINVMAGNIASKEAYQFMCDLGVDIVRVGIGGGSACSTSDATGVGAGSLSIIEEISKYRRINKLNTKIMIDGGIRTSGDVVKSLALGADLVMLGRVLSGFDESPGDIVGADGKKFTIRKLGKRVGSGTIYEYKRQNMPAVEIDDNTFQNIKKYKLFRGLASPSVTQISNELNGNKKYKAPEGIETVVEYKGKLEPFMNDFTFGIKSAFSYFNSENINEFHEYFERRSDSIVLLSQNSIIERRPKYHGEIKQL